MLYNVLNGCRTWHFIVMEGNRPKFWKAEYRREYFYPRYRKHLAGKWGALHNSAGLFLLLNRFN